MRTWRIYWGGGGGVLGELHSAVFLSFSDCLFKNQGKYQWLYYGVIFRFFFFLQLLNRLWIEPVTVYLINFDTSRAWSSILSVIFTVLLHALINVVFKYGKAVSVRLFYESI